MPRVHGKDMTTLTLGGQSLLADTVSLDFSASAETHDVTTLSRSWQESIAGLRGGDEISHELMYDNMATTGTWAFLTNRLGGSAVALVISDGTRTITANVIVTKVGLPVKVSDMLRISASYKLTGAVTFS